VADQPAPFSSFLPTLVGAKVSAEFAGLKNLAEATSGEADELNERLGDSS
jgi:hypothetical protein